MFVFHKHTIKRIIKTLDDYKDAVRIDKLFREVEDCGEYFAVTPLICSRCGCAAITVHPFPIPLPEQCPACGAMTYKIDDERLTLMEHEFGKFGGYIQNGK